MRDNPRILVVDDEAKISTLLKRLLEREGYRVETFQDGRSALDAMLRATADLLITDLKMPGMDGLSLLRRARSIDPDLPVVLITGYASMETAVQALREGVDDYITKPFSLVELKQVVGRIIENRSLAAENRRLLSELTVANAELEQHRQRLTLKVREAETDLLVANEALEHRLRDLEVILEINRMTATIFEQDDLVALAAKLIQDKVGADAVGLLTLDAERERLLARGLRGPPEGIGPGDLIPSAAGILGYALESGAPLLVSELAGDSRPTGAERRTFGAGSLVVVPIRGKEGPAGLLAVSRQPGDADLGEEEINLLTLIANDLAIALENARLFEENERNYIDILAALVESMEARDRYLRYHSERVRGKSLKLATALNLSPQQRDILETGARLHDLGKVGIEDRILQKPGALTDEEMATMQSHPVIGDRIVKPLGKLGAVKGIIRNHHERWDGSGYPDGLAGDGISLLTQIVTVADAFDAMTSDRPYRDAMPRERAIEILGENAGTQFNPFLVELFTELETAGAASGRREAS